MPAHWIAAAVLLPLGAALALVLLAGRGRTARRAVSLGAAAGNLAVATLLAAAAADGGYGVYRLGDWPVPFAIVLVLDRLGAMMVLLTAVVGGFSILHAARGADEEGPFAHALLHLQLAGLNGAFLTGDLFNLFVFFEVLLIASYCLLVYGGRGERLRWGVHYVVLNLVGSALFLLAVGALYGLAGTLNMAHLAERMRALDPADAGLARGAALLLFVVFALKAALAPLYFWLPNAYAAASAPVAALFTIMTKVGVYAIVRLYTLVFGPEAGVVAGAAAPWLLPAALATVVLATLGALAARALRRLNGYLLIASVGIMLAGVGTFSAAGIAAGLYYMVHSTLVMAAMFLLADLIAAERGRADDRLAAARPPERAGALGALFFAGAVGAAGLPPLSGFIGKALVLQAAPAGAWGAGVWSIILVASLLALVALSRAGGILFWTPEPPRDEPGPRSLGPLAPATGLLLTVGLLTALAGPATAYASAAAEQLLHADAYIGAVLGAPGGR